MKLRFGQIEETLQRVHSISEAGESQFQAKLRNLKRVGLNLPTLSAGRRANFQPADLFKLAFAVELLQAGIPPEKTASSVAAHWPDAVEGIFAARAAWRSGNAASHFLVAEPTTLVAPYYRFKPMTGAELSALLADPRGSLAVGRLLIINLTSMLARISSRVSEAGIDRDAFEASLDIDQKVILEKGARVYITTEGEAV